MNVHEIQLKNNDNNSDNNIENMNDNNENEKIISLNQKRNSLKNSKNEITEDKLKNLGFKSLLGTNIYMKNKNKMPNGFDLLNKKRERDKFFKKMYKNGNNDIEEEKMIMEYGKYNNGNIYMEQNQQKRNGEDF